MKRIQSLCFDSILVRLKDESPSRVRFRWQSFDSILVRLKDLLPLGIIGAAVLRFDSILVRLKGFSVFFEVSLQSSFRFHTGSIKSGTAGKLLGWNARFRFHTGSIKRRV